MRLIVYECDARPCSARVEVSAKQPAPSGWVEVLTNAIQFHRPVEPNPRAMSGALAPFVLCPEHGQAFLSNFKGQRDPQPAPSDAPAPRRLPR